MVLWHRNAELIESFQFEKEKTNRKFYKKTASHPQAHQLNK